MTTISITRALVELKRYQAKIDTAISQGTFQAITFGTGADQKVHNTSSSLKEVQALINASFQKVDKLIENRNKLKYAIIESNAVTKVTFRGEPYTIAQLIELKGSVDIYQTYLNKLRVDLTQALNATERVNTQLESEINANTAKFDEKNIDLLSSYRETTLAKKSASVLGESTLKAKIEYLTDFVTDVKSEIDFLLTESNTQTTINFEV